MKKVVVILGLVSLTLFGSEHSHVSISDTDFVYRLVNFIIFVGILWYLLADKVKTFYANRSQAIADSFNEVETKLKESQAHKIELQAEVEEANKKAQEIIEDAKKETEILKANIIESAKVEIGMLNRQFEDYKSYEESKMKKEVVKTYLDNLVKDIHLSSEEVANIVTKKVG
jgi:F-type H+-transporting ATPase subunit b